MSREHTILIVDDSKEERLFLSHSLGKNYRLLEAEDAESALKIAEAEFPDLIVTDIQMPRVDGVEFVKKLRKNPKLASTPVIFHTSLPYIADASLMAVNCGVPFVLAKSSTPELLRDAIDTALTLNDDRKPSKALKENLMVYSADLKPIQKLIESLMENTDKMLSERKQLALMLKVLYKREEKK